MNNIVSLNCNINIVFGNDILCETLRNPLVRNMPFRKVVSNLQTTYSQQSRPWTRADCLLWTQNAGLTGLFAMESGSVTYRQHSAVSCHESVLTDTKRFDTCALQICKTTEICLYMESHFYRFCSRHLTIYLRST